MTSADLEQGTQEWLDARLGKATASRISDVLAKPRSKSQSVSTQRRNYMAQLACEILTGKSAEPQFENWNTKRGMDLEPRARVEYEMRNNVTVRKVGFIQHPSIGRAGCSPDGVIDPDGLVQFKCPIAAVHFDYIDCAKMKTPPTEYFPQLQFELACTGRQYNDFVSYNEQMPDHLQLIVIRCARDEEYIAEIESQVLTFLGEVDSLLAKLPKPEPSFDPEKGVEQFFAGKK